MDYTLLVSVAYCSTYQQDKTVSGICCLLPQVYVQFDVTKVNYTFSESRPAFFFDLMEASCRALVSIVC